MPDRKIKGSPLRSRRNPGAGLTQNPSVSERIFCSLHTADSISAKSVLDCIMMKMQRGFARRRPDYITEELTKVLAGNGSFEFKELFEIVHANLLRRNAASGGEEMLRLKTYEKLQYLVQSGKASKSGKSYKGTDAGASTKTE